MLSRNLRYLRKQRKASQGQIAKAIGISRSALADYENGRSEPTASIIQKFCNHFDVNVNDLLNTDIGTPLFRKSSSEIQSIQNRSLRVVTVTVDRNDNQNIEFVPVTAIAGYALNFSNAEYIGELSHFSIPKLSEGTFRAFEISGDSMPPINAGFVVVGKFIEHYSELKNGLRYILILKNDGVVFKRVINEVSKNRGLILVSDNPDYTSFTIKIDDVLEAWELVSFIGYPSQNVDFDLNIMNKLHLIERKIENLFFNKS